MRIDLPIPSTSASTSQSTTASIVFQQERNTNRTTARSYRLAPRIDLIIDELQQVGELASYEGWDGRGGLPVQSITLGIAQQLLNLMPESIPLPEFGADPDGKIALDWATLTGSDLSLSVADSGRCIFTGSLHGEEIAGAFQFAGNFPTGLAIRISKMIAPTPSILL